MKMLTLARAFAVAKYAALPATDKLREPWFLSRTQAEITLVCPEACLPEGALAVESGWRALMVEGPLDFALTGVLASLTGALAGAGIPVFAVSTFDTDYLLVKSARLTDAARALRCAGVTVEGLEAT